MAVVTGNANLTASFTEVISSGVVSNLTLPATITVNIPYSNGTGALQVDTIYGKQLTLNAAVTTLDLTALTDLNGAAINFARVREFIVENVGPADCKVYANSTSGVTWIGSVSSNGTYVRTAGSASSVWSLYGGVLRIADPYLTGATSGNIVSASSSKIAFDPGANSASVNVLIAGGSATS